MTISVVLPGTVVSSNAIVVHLILYCYQPEEVLLSKDRKTSHRILTSSHLLQLAQVLRVLGNTKKTVYQMMHRGGLYSLRPILPSSCDQ